jgi:hypothetical protein
VTHSALYDGLVTHQRHSPRRHALRYRLFQLLIDLDELPSLDRRLRLFAHNRLALFSLHDHDHGAGDGRPLRQYVEATLRDAGLDIAGGPIRLLTLPRVLGYVFNPLSLYYCHRPSGELVAVILEVTNTFGERHSYLVEAGSGDVVRRSCAKAFFVSPFLGLEMTYDFRLTQPGERVATAIHGRDLAGDLVIAATFAGERRALDDAALLRAFLSHPLITLKVTLGIHWEALKLLTKGVRLRRKPSPPSRPVSVVRSEAVAPAAQQAQPQRRAGTLPLVTSRS